MPELTRKAEIVEILTVTNKVTYLMLQGSKVRLSSTFSNFNGGQAVWKNVMALGNTNTTDSCETLRLLELPTEAHTRYHKL